MDVIGIICEYNPFHNGHAYHINKIKEMYPNSLIVLALNGYFLERGEISIINKEDKTRIALENDVDIVIEIPFVFGSNSADIFSETAVKLLNYLKVDKIIFGSESNDIPLLTKIAEAQLEESFNDKVKENIAKGINYPTALNKAIGIDISTPNDLLGISYIKAIIKNGFDIEPISIQRTNSYHDNDSNDNIVSASNIREKLKSNQNVDKYTSYAQFINQVDEILLFNLLKYKINTEENLNKYLTVDEGLEYKLIKEINKVSSVNELILKIKSKRYTYNRLQRMLIHILVGLTKEDKNNLEIEYIKLLGFNDKGQKYINTIKKDISLPLDRKISDDYVSQKYELRASIVYDLLTNDKTSIFENSNKPIYHEK